MSLGEVGFSHIGAWAPTSFQESLVSDFPRRFEYHMPLSIHNPLPGHIHWLRQSQPYLDFGSWPFRMTSVLLSPASFISWISAPATKAFEPVRWWSERESLYRTPVHKISDRASSSHWGSKHWGLSPDEWGDRPFSLLSLGWLLLNSFGPRFPKLLRSLIPKDRWGWDAPPAWSVVENLSNRLL